MNRRDVLVSGAAVVAVAIAGVSTALADLPVLWGDGEHDDTAALQHFLDGGEVQRPDGTVVRGWVDGGHFRCTDTLHIRAGQAFRVRGAIFEFA